MKTTKKIALLLLLISLTGCMGEGDYSDGEEEWVNNLCNATWTNSYNTPDGQYTEKYAFKRNGTVTRTYIFTSPAGESETNTQSLLWTFTDLSFGIIYFDDDIYFEIDRLDAEHLFVYKRIGNIPPFDKEYIEFVREV